MNNRLLTLITVGIFSILSLNVSAQEKERNDTDYTNNRKDKKNSTVNTKQQTPVKIIQYIPGSWTVEQVLRGKEDITGTDTLARNQKIEFNREGRYMSYTGTEMIDSGAYRINENTSRLYLESDVAESDTEWNVWFDRSGIMTLQLVNGNQHAEDFRYVYRRTGSVSTRR
jgi:hypothetical protein